MDDFFSLVDFLVAGLVGWKFCSLFYCLVGWWVACLVGCLVAWFVV